MQRPLGDVLHLLQQWLDGQIPGRGEDSTITVRFQSELHLGRRRQRQPRVKVEELASGAPSTTRGVQLNPSLMSSSVHDQPEAIARSVQEPGGYGPTGREGQEILTKQVRGVGLPVLVVLNETLATKPPQQSRDAAQRLPIAWCDVHEDAPDILPTLESDAVEECILQRIRAILGPSVAHVGHPAAVQPLQLVDARRHLVLVRDVVLVELVIEVSPSCDRPLSTLECGILWPPTLHRVAPAFHLAHDVVLYVEAGIPELLVH
mmetsp:Transcript_160436/g.514942  ORF Transcript_160436/g.514942 Transcript_160436/m.514942 type:complete len:262 (-) Transcript_160436:655-1440(-)